MQTRVKLKLSIHSATLLAFTLMGCGAGGEVTPISGMVTFQGEPVPAGNVTFIELSSTGDRGRKVVYDIQDGLYESAGDQGIVKGSQYLVEVDGYEALSGSSDEDQIRLFPIWQSELDRPLELDTYDIEVQSNRSR